MCIRDSCNIDLIEAVERRAARSTLKDWSRASNQPPATGMKQTIVRGSPSSMLQYLGWDFEPELLWCTGQFTELLQYLSIRTSNGILMTPVVTSSSSWSQQYEWMHTVSVFFPATVTLWNSLPTEVILAPSVSSFNSWAQIHRDCLKIYPKTCRKIILRQKLTCPKTVLRHVVSQFTTVVLGDRKCFDLTSRYHGDFDFCLFT